MRYYIISEEDLETVQDAARCLMNYACVDGDSLDFSNEVQEVYNKTKQFKYNYDDYDPEPTEDIQKDMEVIAREFGGEF
jgi:hypothetical protein